MVLCEKDILTEAKAMKDEMIHNRRYLHENPELGLDLLETREFVENKLQEMGYTDIRRVGQAGLTTTVGTGKGKVFMLRADMDALPILEDNDLSYKSKIEGRMHACGHDMHTTMLLAAAKILKIHEEEIPGTVKLMFQPGEEIMEGAHDMMTHGVLENPKPDAAVMIHVMPAVPFDVGTVLVSEGGPTMASVDWFKITIQGKGGHGSTPYLTSDPLVPMSAIHSALNTIQSRDLPPNAVVSITVGEISGGETSNVIPDKISMGGTIRTYDEVHRKLIKERISEISENIAKAFRCTATADFPVGAPYFETNAELSKHLQNVLPKYLEGKYIPPIKQEIPVMGSEDFAYISHKIPTALMMLAASDLRKGETYSVHHPKLVLDEECLPYGAAAYVGAALSWLESN
ncbi:M20 metallopeptidase family protein [Vagococcus elongatus]|uniref:Peptidase M20 dimerisation domain-containing protein n=1 Tax=Vagococcus elongatus TaxID=180344 RepID=A0A430AU05_9ENTE|nr:M20 family metallopeptidase [Vagococcus elongatus]RSU11535.1 hypothetical protein CBF29_07575 [Vagococcus elongatus]